MMTDAQIKELAKKLNAPDAGKMAAETFGTDVPPLSAPEVKQEPELAPAPAAPAPTPAPKSATPALPSSPTNMTSMEKLLLLKMMQDDQERRGL